MLEVEILVKVLESKKSALQKLQKLKNKGIAKIHDQYFYDPLRKNLQQDKKGKLRESFRLRLKNEKAHLTYKKDRFDNKGIWGCAEEHEVSVSDANETRTILELLGLKPLVEIENTRHVFETDKYEIVLEEVKGLGLFLEVERWQTSEKEDVNTLKKEIQVFINTLGLKVSQEIEAGKPELAIRQKKQKKLELYRGNSQRRYKSRN